MAYNNLIPPTQVIVGDTNTTHTYIYRYLKKIYCQNNECNTCQICIAIEKQQHPQQLWISPEKTYTKDQLLPIMHSLSFIVDQNTHFFCIITYADLLTPLCANSLLKSLEEPPHNYHFILTTEREDQLLATIRSRAIINILPNNLTIQQHAELFNLFTQHTVPITLSGCIGLIKKIDQSKTNENEIRILLEDLITHYHQRTMIVTTTTETNYYSYRIQILYALLEKPIMPGSGKFILKQLFLNFFLI